MAVNNIPETDPSHRGNDYTRAVHLTCSQSLTHNTSLQVALANNDTDVRLRCGPTQARRRPRSTIPVSSATKTDEEENTGSQNAKEREVT